MWLNIIFIYYEYHDVGCTRSHPEESSKVKQPQYPSTVFQMLLFHYDLVLVMLYLLILDDDWGGTSLISHMYKKVLHNAGI